MKKILIALVLGISLVSCQTTDKKATGIPGQEDVTKVESDPASLTTIQWIDSTNQNLGAAKEGQVVEVSYRFKNTGTKNLVIESVTAGCGCTVAEKPEKPIAPGEEQLIKAKFDSKGRVGPNHKYLTVVANTTPEKTHTLNFQIEVSK